MMANALFQLFFDFPIVLLAELIAVLILGRLRVRHRLAWVIGSYLLCVAAALSVALIRPDEFGFGFIPLLVMTAPWQLLHLNLPFAGDLPQVIIGLALHCALFYLLSRVVSPARSTEANAPQAT